MENTRFIAKRCQRTRGHAELVERVGGVFAEVEERLMRRRPVRVLELGCGYGTVLLELSRRYGRDVEVHGINRRPRDGDATALLRNGVERGLLVPGRDAGPLPSIVFVDVARGLPFPDDSFDVVFSQVAWLYFGDKLRVLRETSRTLRDDGIAKIDADEIRSELPREYQRLVEIWNDGRLITLTEYLRPHGIVFEPATIGEYLLVHKSSDVGRDVRLLFEVELSAISPKWRGRKCVYRLCEP